jgi:hypothetical protein
MLAAQMASQRPCRGVRARKKVEEQPHALAYAPSVRLKLTAIRDRLDNLIEEAARREITLREPLFFL